MKNAYQVVRVFGKVNDALGNLAAIVIDNDTSELSEFIEVSISIEKKHNIATTCFVKHLTDEQYLVRCFNTKNEIKCCGHGMIAAAKTLFLKGNESQVIINNNLITSYDIEGKEKGSVTMALPRVSSTSQEPPNWVSYGITYDGKALSPSSSAVSAEIDGYLLFEFDPLLPLDVFSALQLDLKQVCENTKRAVVIIQFDLEKEQLYLRYFAPQYGVTEDSATGSVIRFVGSYIEQKYQCKYFAVRQCSSQGGFMNVECTAEKIIITANATIEK